MKFILQKKIHIIQYILQYQIHNLTLLDTGLIKENVTYFQPICHCCTLKWYTGFMLTGNKLIKCIHLRKSTKSILFCLYTAYLAGISKKRKKENKNNQLKIQNDQVALNKML